jgi:hypothetical protein
MSSANAYRRLLWAYPARYRASRGEEIISTLMEAAPHRRRPTPRDAMDLACSGLLTRFGFGHVPGLAGGSAIASVVALAAAGGLGVFHWLRWAFDDRVGLVFLAWPAAALLVAALPRFGRPVILLALLASVIVIPAGVPPLNLVVELLAPSVYGLIALIGWPRDASPPYRITALAGTPAALGALVALAPVSPSATFLEFLDASPALFTDRPLLNPFAPAWMGFLLLAGMVLIAFARRRVDRRWGWAALLLAVPAGPGLRLVIQYVDRPPLIIVQPPYLEAAITGTAFAVGVVVVVWLAGRPVPGTAGAQPDAPATGRTLGTAAGVALAGSAGLAGAWWLTGEWVADDGTNTWVREAPFGPFHTMGPLAYSSWLLAAAGYAAFGARTARVLTALALVTTVGLPVLELATGFAAPDQVVLVPFVLLGMVALVALSVRPSRSERMGLGVGAAALVLAGVLIARRLDDEMYVAVAAMIGMLAVVPYAVIAAFVAADLRSGRPRRIAASVVLTVALVGLCATTLVNLTDYGTALMAAIAATAVGLVGLSARIARRVRWRPADPG